MISSLNEEYTSRISLEKEIELKMYEINRLRNISGQKHVRQNQLTMDIAVMIMSLNDQVNNQQVNNVMEEVFLEDEDEGNNRRRLRATLNELAAIVSFTYCSENTNNMTDERLAEINRHLQGN